MKKKLLGLLSLTALAAGTWFAVQHRRPEAENELRLMQFDNEEGELSKEERALFTRKRWEHEQQMLKNPLTGEIPLNIRQTEMALARSMPTRESIMNGPLGADNLYTYLPAGPDNIGGRTRAVAYDKRYNGTSNKVIIAGSVSGGIMRSTDGGTTWTRTSPDDDIHNLVSLAQDPRAGFEDTWYAGGGEPIANSASGPGAFYLGYGVWKSINNGATWTRLTRTVTDITGATLGGGALEAFDNPLDMCHRIAVNPVNGHVYVAAHRRIIRSTDGGVTWNVIFTGTTGACSDNGQTDVVITNTGKVYIAINGGNPDSGIRGIWTSATGNANSFTRIAGGSTLGTDSVANWRANSYVPSQFCSGTFISRRIVMALAPSNNNILYVTYENGDDQSSASSKTEADLYKLDATSGNVWTNLSANVPDFPGQLDGVDPFHIQEGYDLMVAVKPNDPNTVFLGGVNLFRSTNGFSSAVNTSWIGGYGISFASGLNIYGSKTNPNDFSLWSHPDMHALVFNPSDPNEAICANDGGIQITANIMGTTAGDEPVLWEVVPEYQTIQYYHVAMDPGAGRFNFIGGAQDNGTRYRDGSGLIGPSPGNSHYRILSGDGGMAQVAKVNGSTQDIYGSTQFGNIIKGTLSAGSLTGGSIRPSGLTATPGLSNAYGDFVTYYKLDFDNNSDLYYVNFNRLFRSTNATSTYTSITWTELTGVSSSINPAGGTNVSISALEMSRGDYNTGHALYIGTTDGRVFRLNDPRNAGAGVSPVNITPSSPVMNGYVSDIAVNPNDDAEIMVTVSNYGVTSVFWTKTAKSANPTWYSAEGTMPTPSFRSCMIVVKKDASNNPVTEYFVGTSMGLYSAVNVGTTLLGGGTVNWVREGGSVLNFAVVTSLDYRPQDNYLLVGTHGNGMYYAQTGTPDFRPSTGPTPVIDPVRNDKNFIQRAYPTVVSDQIFYQTGNMFTVKKLTVQLYNSNGQLVSRKETGYTSGTVDMRAMSKGTYILTITSEDRKQQFVQKLVKR